ncbi:MAG TPA: hypothetical protein VJ875_04900 [Pyrinomonadaceae bacterium]|nr:hypothetical protein [Pyrinomonadaceae bacterium]
MQVTAKSWRLSTAIYRMLVAAQTIAWAAMAAANVISRRPRASLAVDRVGIALAVGAVVGLAGGLLAYYRPGARTRPSEHEAVIVTWACFQGAGLLALMGYALTGAVVCFVAELVVLALMHAFSPNRLPNTHKQPEG